LALVYAFILSFRTNSLEHIMTSPWTIRFRKIIPRFTLIGLVQPIVAHPIICVSACARGDRTPWSISSPDSTKNVICFVAVVDFCLRKIVLTGYLTRFTLSTSELCTTWVLSTQTLTWFGCWNTSFGGLLWPLKIPSSLPPQLKPFWYNLETLISLPVCLNMTLVMLSATSKYRVKTMNSRIVDMNRSFPLSKTFPKL
jgi:hypothetical protein